MSLKIFRSNLKNVFSKSFAIPAQMNPWEWAENNIEFPAVVSPLPGKYSTVNTPYVKEVLEAFSDPTVRQITLCWSAQSSKTTTALVGILYSIDNDPGNVLIVRPSLTAAKSLSENKIMPIIKQNKCLNQHMTGDRDDFQKTMLKLKPSILFFRGANPNQLSAESCKIVYLDETDKYDAYNENKAEADLVDLAFERTKFYRNSKKVASSTPTIPTGTIWQLFNEADQRKYLVPCPNCGAEFDFQFNYFRWVQDTDDYKIIKKNAWFECPHCNEKIEERHKTAMMLAGRWVSQNSDSDGEHKSYHLNEFYSPITKWGDLAVKFLKAQKKAKVGDFGPLHNFINSSLAEPWDPAENSSRKLEEIEILRDEREIGVVPENAIGLTAGVDTQDLGFWFTIRAWSTRDFESWQILSGKADTFEDIERIMLDSEYKSKSGKIFKVSGGLFDSGGHRTSEVYDWCRKHRVFRPSKGERRMPRPWDLSKIDKMPNGSPLPGGVKLVKINTTYYKDLLAGKLTVAPDEPGAFHLLANPGIDYLKHMTAEYRNDKGVWICPTHKRNDLWDCEVMALCCADLMGLKFMAIKDETQNKEIQNKSKKPASNPYLSKVGSGKGNPYIGR